MHRRRATRHLRHRRRATRRLWPFFFWIFSRFEFLNYFFTVCFINLLFALLFALSIYCARVGRRLSLVAINTTPPVHSPASPRAKERGREGRREKGEGRREKREERREGRKGREEVLSRYVFCRIICIVRIN